VAKVTMPQLGESVAEGTIGKWLKQPGDTVDKYEPLLEVITDKVNAEVPSPFAGVLKEILVEEGATVPNNAEIAVIETADEASAGGTAEAPQAPADSKVASGATSAEPTTPSPAPSAPELVPADGPAGSDERPERAAASAAAPTAVAAEASVGSTEPAEGHGNPDARMTPAVRRLLREHGLTAAQIVGSGGGGRITREDVTNYVESQRTGQSVGGQAVGGAAAQAPAAAAAASSNGSAAAPASAPAAAPALAAPTLSLIHISEPTRHQSNAYALFWF
jgi:pyruvate/2-oxoglutarate dehydrogenase complex dihydrolipoamide acyltransferase (E2) component